MLKKVLMVLALVGSVACSSVDPKPFVCGAPAPAGKLFKVEKGTGRHIVVLKPSAGPWLTLPSGEIRKEVRNLTKDIQSLVSIYKVAKVDRYLKGLEGFSAVLTETQVELLRKDPRVKYVQMEGYKKINEIWNLDRMDQPNLPLDNVYLPGADGAGIHIFIIDTGLDESHPDFIGRIGEGFTVVGNSNEDGHGHGTHVAGTAAGTKYGVAKKVTIHGYRVLDSQGSGTDTDIIVAIDKVAEICKANGWACVANMSLGGSPAPALDEAVCKAIANGVTFVVAGGNDNLNACNYSPSRVDLAIVAGASTIDDYPASFSNDGKCITLYSPGLDVESDWPGGGTNKISGTSMASPGIAGAAALCLQKHPGSPAMVKQCVVDLAVKGVLNSVPADTPNSLVQVEK